MYSNQGNNVHYLCHIMKSNQESDILSLLPYVLKQVTSFPYIQGEGTTQRHGIQGKRLNGGHLRVCIFQLLKDLAFLRLEKPETQPLWGHVIFMDKMGITQTLTDTATRNKVR